MWNEETDYFGGCLEEIAHPFWEAYTDLQFAHVLFMEALDLDLFVSPWGDHVDVNKDYLSPSEGSFLISIQEWVMTSGAGAESEADWLQAGKAALAHDVAKLVSLVKPLTDRWIDSRFEDDEDEDDEDEDEDEEDKNQHEEMAP